MLFRSLLRSQSGAPTPRPPQPPSAGRAGGAFESCCAEGPLINSERRRAPMVPRALGSCSSLAHVPRLCDASCCSVARACARGGRFRSRGRGGYAQRARLGLACLLRVGPTRPVGRRPTRAHEAAARAGPSNPHAERTDRKAAPPISPSPIHSVRASPASPRARAPAPAPHASCSSDAATTIRAARSLRACPCAP